ncbi:hypothetical protein [Flavobacterium sp. CSZ]|uniref:hypothetical protein n=1 Tax=Flavobacterium sp. CSZ TaxID=2783791 RepID=UPI00188D8152|nr:hypothetical protein [Flavobacterium sp. CSZ]MBF4485036.1 hypothetical protein [Flavobacterium sp. CSZ]
MIKNNVKNIFVFFSFLYVFSILTSCKNTNKDIDFRDIESKASYTIDYIKNEKSLILNIHDDIDTVYGLIFYKNVFNKEFKIALDPKTKFQMRNIVKDQIDLKAVLRKPKIKSKFCNEKVKFKLSYSQYHLESEFTNIHKMENISIDFKEFIENLEKKDKVVRKFFN